MCPNVVKKNNMKIIHIALGKANPNRMNGVNKVVHQLANTQVGLGYDVTLWGIANNLDHNYPERKFKTVLFQQQKSKQVCPTLKAAIKSLPAETSVHIHGAFILEFYHISRLLLKANIPYTFTPHGSFVEAAMQKNKWVKKVYFELLEKKLIKDANAIQLLGINEFTHLDNLMTTHNKQLIPNGIDLTKIPTLPRSTEKEMVFGFCGRLDTYHKGLDLMLKGFQLFLNTGGQGRLELIGDGKDKPNLMGLAKKLGIDHKVVFHGALFGLPKFQTLRTFDVFLHTSRMEGFPMAILEAAALSIPCLTSDATNINSYIKDYQAGFPIATNTPSTIASAMLDALFHYRENELPTKGVQARNMVEECFDWTTIAKQLIEVYRAA